MSQDAVGTGRTALIVGASRGLGLGLVRRHLERGWQVIATMRGPAAELEAITPEGRLAIERLDLTDPASLDALAIRLAGTALDLLFVNGGIMDDPGIGAAQTSDASFARLLLTNALGPIRLIERLRGQVRAGGVVAAMSSGLGSVANNTSGGYESYRASKAALNTLLRSVAADAGRDGRTYLAVDPGWVRTDMGGASAPLDVEASTGGIAEMLERRRGQGGSAFVSHRDRDVAW